MNAFPRWYLRLRRSPDLKPVRFSTNAWASPYGPVISLRLRDAEDASFKIEMNPSEARQLVQELEQRLAFCSDHRDPLPVGCRDYELDVTH